MSTTAEKLAFWAFVTLVTFSFFYLAYSQETKTPEEKITHQLRMECSSKVRGSRPHCWSEADWEAFCEHVECKPQSHKE